MLTTRIFIHGLESSAKGTKGIYFSDNFPGMIVKDYRGSAAERLQQLTQIVGDKAKVLIVGSSYGGLVGAMYALENPDRVVRLVMLAPALDTAEFAAHRHMVTPAPTFLFHGNNDVIVAPTPVRAIATRCFPNLQYHLVEDDHLLTETFPRLDWKTLLV